MCPHCKTEYDLPEGYFTFYCAKCDALLLHEETGVVYDFHQRLHEKDKRWPKDGRGTGSLIIG